MIVALHGGRCNSPDVDRRLDKAKNMYGNRVEDRPAEGRRAA